MTGCFHAYWVLNIYFFKNDKQINSVGVGLSKELTGKKRKEKKQLQVSEIGFKKIPGTVYSSLYHFQKFLNYLYVLFISYIILFICRIYRIVYSSLLVIFKKKDVNYCCSLKKK